MFDVQEPGNASLKPGPSSGVSGLGCLAWEALPDGCWRLTSPGFSMNSGLVVGTRTAVLIDSGSGPREAAAIHRAVRRITGVGLIVVNTHAHGDHFLGNDYFRDQGVTDFYAGVLALERMRETETEQRSLVRDLEPEMASSRGEHTRIHLPTHTVGSAPYEINLGDRFVTLQQIGSAHSPGDLTVHAGRVVFAGDVIEQGGPPNFEDSRPVQWLHLLDGLAATEATDTIFVPGHGGCVGLDFVQRQAAQLRGAIETCRAIAAAHGAGASPDAEALSVLPYGPVESRFLYERLMATRP